MSIHTTTRAPRRTAQEQQRLLDRFEASGLGQSEFCRREGINVGTFYSWRRKHQGRMASSALVSGSGSEERPPNDGEWLALPVAGLDRCNGRWDVELELGDGITLRLSKG